MIAIVRARTLHNLRAGIADAETATETARIEAEQRRQEAECAIDSAIRAESVVEELRAALARATADAGRLEGELETLRAQSFLDTEDRQALRMLLRVTRKQNGLADRVYVLFRRGELHSVHATVDAAEARPARDGPRTLRVPPCLRPPRFCGGCSRCPSEVSGEVAGRGDVVSTLPVFRWRLAPDGYATYRQLRAMGLRPGGQGVAAELQRPRRRRGPLVAYLYRIDRAKPVRPMTPARWAALARANAAQQICPNCRRAV
jgi:hypothetical protein